MLNKFSLLSSLIDFYNINVNISAGISFKLFLNDIGFYTYKYDINSQVLFLNKEQRGLFLFFKKHPLLFWKLEIIFNNHIIVLDFVTNTSNKNKFNSIILNNVNFINSPSLILQDGMFLSDFAKNSYNQDFFNTWSQIEEYKKLLLKELHQNTFNRGVFLQEFYDGALHNTQHMRKIILYNKLI